MPCNGSGNMLGSRLAVWRWRLGDICALLYARCIFRTLFKKSGNKESAGRSRGVTCKRSHICVFLEYVCFRGCIFWMLLSYITTLRVPGWVRGVYPSYFLLIFSEPLSVKHAPHFLPLFHRLNPKKNTGWKKKSGLCPINISETFEYRHNEHAVLNLNF